jgi:UDP-N-acetylglucosamine transferase subunit ALG13
MTVGSVLPFDRLVQAVDSWAGRNGREDLFGQIGQARYQPKHMEWKSLLEPLEFRRRFAEAELIIAHAGIGTILTAMELCKPLVIMPRRAALHEHTSDHQMATAKRFTEERGIAVAYDEASLHAQLDHIDRIRPLSNGETANLDALVNVIRNFINGQGI